MEESIEKVGQSQVHDLLFGEKLSWQAIIYDLINTEQLDPWDIDISLLSQKYLEKVQKLEEANFFVSSKVLLAASLLLRLKSEVILNHDLPGLDEILHGKKEQRKYDQERIELDEEIPDLVPRTPLPRFKKVTLKELLGALGKAIKTENRRIKKEILLKQHDIEAAIVVPKNTINLKDKIKDIYARLRNIFSDRDEKLSFTELLEMSNAKNENSLPVKLSELEKVSQEEKITAFVSLLHLDTQQKVWLEQKGHFEEIFVLMKRMYETQNKEEINRLKMEVDSLEEKNTE